MQNDYLIQARIQAGYPSRETAVMAVPFSASVIGRHERGEIPLQPADILAYEAGYCANGLQMLYCRNTCPIGCGLHPDLQERQLSALTLRVWSQLKKAMPMLDRLADIAEDDRVDPNERPEFDSIIEQFRILRGALDEAELYYQRVQAKRMRQSAGNRTAATLRDGESQSQYRTGRVACQRG